MSFRVSSDLVPLFKGLVISLEPYAAAQQVELNFKSSLKNQNSYYNPDEIIPQLSNFLISTIAFTPQHHKINLSLDKSNTNNSRCILSIQNTGVNLENITEIRNKIRLKVRMEKLNTPGTRFRIEIPIRSESENIPHVEQSATDTEEITQYYFKVSQRLKSFFGTVDELEASAMLTGFTEGVFLKKVNAIISSHIHDNNFNVDALAASVALSRTQLFRKLKQLTKMSPGRYILYFRLQQAKRLLQSKEKNLNVSEVCYQLGFLSKSYFSRSFQKQFGFPPSKCK
ncbi:MAG: AraC family transcriptional regulator [Flavobacteriaceae bacterium]